MAGIGTKTARRTVVRGAKRHLDRYLWSMTPHGEAALTRRGGAAYVAEYRAAELDGVAAAVWDLWKQEEAAR